MFTRRSLLFLAAVLTAGASEPSARAVESIGFTVSDLDRSLAFFTGVLTFEKISEHEAAGADYERLQGVFGLRIRTAKLRLGTETIELTEYLAPEGKPMPPGTRGNDRWFQHIAIVVSDMDAAYKRLRQHRVKHASTGPQLLPAWNPNAGGIEAFYFRDPDGHFLELIKFPKGKGDSRWQQSGGKIFLGIDHTAVVTADTEASLRFYRDALGLQIAGASENHGVEQEHLNNVFGARLRITALRAAHGPGIELLEYLAPRDGREYPADAKSNDLLHWQTRIRVASADNTLARLREERTRLISPGVVSIGTAKQFLVRDPDGYALMIDEH